jgi:hypothetical protein
MNISETAKKVVAKKVVAKKVVAKKVVAKKVVVKKANKGKGSNISMTPEKTSVTTVATVATVAKVKKVEQLVYLKAGVSGKQLTSAKKAVNAAWKAEASTVSFCLAQVKKNLHTSYVDEQGNTALPLSKLFQKCEVNKLIPANILPFLTDAQITRHAEQVASGKEKRFGVYMVLGLCIKYLRAANTPTK